MMENTDTIISPDDILRMLEIEEKGNAKCFPYGHPEVKEHSYIVQLYTPLNEERAQEFITDMTRGLWIKTFGKLGKVNVEKGTFYFMGEECSYILPSMREIDYDAGDLCGLSLDEFAERVQECVKDVKEEYEYDLQMWKENLKSQYKHNKEQIEELKEEVDGLDKLIKHIERHV